MVSFNDVQAQLESIDSHFRFLGISEVKKIANTLQPGEQIMACLKGWYNGAMAVFCATDKRIVIISKNSASKDMKCIGYENVCRISHQDNSLMPKLSFYCNKEEQYHFSSWRVKRLKQMHEFIKRHMVYIQEQSDAAQETVFKSRLQSKLQTTATSRNVHAFARRLGNASILN